ncbi:MAG: SAM-dependent methyltransferase [Muribaculaceae bacterium]|nr:SAM-dependent methyltransferase [Muribaculaceae bacterium]
MSQIINSDCDFQATINFVKEHAADDVQRLALEVRKHPEVDAHFALDQIAGRQKSRTKLPSWAEVDDLIFPPSVSMEQCSSEATASYKSSLVSGEFLVDLTGGFGVDFSFLANRFSSAVYVERQEHLCHIAEHNFKVLGLSHVQVVNDNAEHYLATMPVVDLIYLDPARRDGAGNRVFRLDDCTPNVVQLLDLLLTKGRQVMIKLSPMLDVSQALRQLRGVSEVHIVSVAGECKELLLLLSAKHEGDVKIVCVNDGQTFTYRLGEPVVMPMQWSGELPAEGDLYLYEPNASMMKAGCFGQLAQRYGLQAVAQQSHLFVAERPISDFQGRKFVVNDITTLNSKKLKQKLAGITQANVAVRNFPLKAAELAKRLRLKDGGSVYIFGTRLANGKNVLLLCEKAPF